MNFHIDVSNVFEVIGKLQWCSNIRFVQAHADMLRAPFALWAQFAQDSDALTSIDEDTQIPTVLDDPTPKWIPSEIHTESSEDKWKEWASKWKSKTKWEASEIYSGPS